MSQIKELKNDIAASLFISPCKIEELEKADFLKNKSSYGVHMICGILEQDGAMYFKGDNVYQKSMGKTEFN